MFFVERTGLQAGPTQPARPGTGGYNGNLTNEG